MELGLGDARAVVVGGGRGMGLAAARCLAADGARVALVGRTRSTLAAAADELDRGGSPDAFGVVADIGDDDQVAAAFTEIGRRFGGALNILINAVGPNTVGGFEDLDDDRWRRAVDDGALGMVRCVRAGLPLLRRADWARIVNFSAHSTQRQSTTLVAYTAAKAMVTSISKNLSLLLAPDEILVNVISPGSIATEALLGWAESAGVDGGDPYALMAGIGARFGHPAQLPRAGLPDEVGAVAAFLASRRNSYMTGANVNVDGGSDFT